MKETIYNGDKELRGEFRLNGSQDVLATVICSLLPFDVGDTSYQLAHKYINKFIIDMVNSFKMNEYNPKGLNELADACERQNDELREYISEVMSYVLEEQFIQEQNVYSNSNFKTLHCLERDTNTFKSIYRKKRYPKAYQELFKGFTEVVNNYYNYQDKILGSDIQKVVECFATAGRIYMLLKPSKYQREQMYKDYINVVEGERKMLALPGFNTNGNHIIRKEDTESFNHSVESQAEFVEYCNQYLTLIQELANLTPRQARLEGNKKLLKRHQDIVNLYKNSQAEVAKGYDNKRDVYESTSSTGSSLEIICPEGFENEFQNLQFSGVLAKGFDTLENIIDGGQDTSNKDAAEAISNIKSILGINSIDEALCLPVGQEIELVRYQQRIKPYDKPKIEWKTDVHGNRRRFVKHGEPYGEPERCVYKIVNKSQFAMNIAIDKPGYGIRCITMASNCVQDVLAYFQNILKRLMSKMKADCTIRQENGIIFSMNLTMQEEYNHASFDLSKCTDNMDLGFQEWVLKNFVFYNKPELVTEWVKLMKIDINFSDGSKHRFYNGQAQGFLSSFPSFALTHHILVNILYFIEERKYEDMNGGMEHPDKRPYYKRYRVLGDDFICSFIGETMLHLYPEGAARINVKCHIHKGFRYIKGSNIPEYRINRAEFAKRTFCRGLRISGISSKLISKLYNNAKYMYDVIRDLRNSYALQLPYTIEDEETLDKFWVSEDFDNFINRKAFDQVIPNEELIAEYIDVLHLPIPEGLIKKINYRDVIRDNCLNLSYYGGLIESNHQYNGFRDSVMDIPDYDVELYNKTMFKIYISMKILSIGLKYTISKTENERIERNLISLKSTKERTEYLLRSVNDVIQDTQSSIRLQKELYDMQGLDFNNSFLYKSLQKEITFKDIKENLYNYEQLIEIDESEEEAVYKFYDDVLCSEAYAINMAVVLDEAEHIMDVSEFVNYITETNIEDIDPIYIDKAINLISIFENNKYKKNMNSIIDSAILVYMHICKEWFLTDKESLVRYFNNQDCTVDLSKQEEEIDFTILEDLNDLEW